MQKKVTQKMPLLTPRGELSCPGYATSPVWRYDRGGIRAGKLRIKEWDYYLVYNSSYALALTIADNSYMGLSSISFLDFASGYQQTLSPMRLLPMGSTSMPATSELGNVRIEGTHYYISFENDGFVRHLTCHMDNFRGTEDMEADIHLENIHTDSMVIATPFAGKRTSFYYNQKINCLPADGYVILGNDKFQFRPGEAFGTLDWGRGVWTYSNTWYWGSASGLVGGVPFGFNIGYGFGDTASATENMLFYNGKAHKLDHVSFNIPTLNGKCAFMKPWTFSSTDGRFEMDFVPVMDRSSDTNVLLIESDQHQVFGWYSGRAVLDDGSVIEIKDFMGFAEKVKNRW